MTFGLIVEYMDRQEDVAEFLRSRRDRITPEQAGIIGGGRRRVPGLRREEVALLAGVSVDYYARMERGNLSGVSPEVLDSLALALHLDEAETDHLHDLARATIHQAPQRRKPVERTLRPSLQRFIDAAADVAIVIRDRRMTYLFSNALGHALYAPLFDDPVNQNNMARFMFLNPASRNFFPDWEQVANDIAATMRTYAGQHPRDKALSDIIGELMTRSDDFGRRWAMQNVRHHRTGIKHYHHPEVGDLELTYEALDLPLNPEWYMFASTAESGTPSEERLRLLGSLAVSQNDVSVSDLGPSN